MSFPLPTPPHTFTTGDRARYVNDQVNGEVLEVSTDYGNLGLPYCLMGWDDADDPAVRSPTWVLMQHLWPLT